MRSLRLLLSMLLFSVATLLVAQSGQMDHSQPTSPKGAPSEAQKSFDLMKSLAGEWTGKVIVEPPIEGPDNGQLHVAMRVTSRGNALLHEMSGNDHPADPKDYDHPLTMFYIDGDQLTLTHYCDAGNRPRMVARPSADGKTIEFDFAGLSGSDKHGHMVHAVFNIIDANHHTEDWTYMMPGNKPMHGRLDLHRVNDTGAATAGK